MGKLGRLLDKIIINFSRNGIIKHYRKKGAKIGENCDINKNFSIVAEPYLVKIGNNVRITSGVKFITHDGGIIVARRSEECQSICENIKNADIFGKIEVGNNVHIGVNAIVMPDVVIGDNVIIGAGAIVTKNVPSNSIALGVPARVIKSLTQYVEDNKGAFVYTKSMSYEEKRKFIESK